MRTEFNGDAVGPTVHGLICEESIPWSAWPEVTDWLTKQGELIRLEQRRFRARG